MLINPNSTGPFQIYIPHLMNVSPVFTGKDRILPKNNFPLLNNLLTLPVKQVLHSMLSPMLSESSR